MRGRPLLVRRRRYPLRLSKKRLGLAGVRLGRLLPGLRDLAEFVAVFRGRLVIRFGRSVDPPLLEPPVMLVRHLQVFAGQLIKEVAGGLGRLPSLPLTGATARRLKSFSASPGDQDVGPTGSVKSPSRGNPRPAVPGPSATEPCCPPVKDGALWTRWATACA